jgi:hypothetical protein
VNRINGRPTGAGDALIDTLAKEGWMGRKHRLRRQAAEQRQASMEAAWALSGWEGGRWKGRGLLIGWDVVLQHDRGYTPYDAPKRLEGGFVLKLVACLDVAFHDGMLKHPAAMHALLDVVAPKRFFNPSEAWKCNRRDAALICAVLTEDSLCESAAAIVEPRVVP